MQETAPSTQRRETVYRYRMSRKRVAFRLLLWIVVAWGWLGLALAAGVDPQSETMVWGARGTAAASVVLFAIALWNLANPGVYEVHVTRDTVRVDDPNHPTHTFELPVADIAWIETRRYSRSAGGDSHGHWLVAHDGRSYPITTNYFSSIRRLESALISVNPEIRHRVRRTCR
ncbi:MAG: hypothetical protein AAF488_07075 [Planctomycetota bacterium]